MVFAKVALTTLPPHRLWNSRWLYGIAIAGLLITTGCNSTTPTADTSADPATEESQTSPESDEKATIVSSFADQVVIPTYEDLVAESGELVVAIEAFTSDPTDDTLQAAQEAWKSTRVPWEQSEAFAFGPASSLGYDGDLDDWPVNEADMEAVLVSSDEITPDYIGTLQTTQKGFHAIELVLFGVENSKTAADFTEQELAYLNAAAVAFDQTANDLLTSWKDGIDGNPAYREVLATAGESENPAYPTVDAGTEEILQGMIGCLDEVANEKIGEPLETKDTLGFESRFSQSSLTDFENNLRSVQKAYLGQASADSPSSDSLSAWVAEENPELDQQVQSEIQTAIDAVAAIPAPVETNVDNAEAITQMTAAQAAILELYATLEDQVLPLVQG